MKAHQFFLTLLFSSAISTLFAQDSTTETMSSTVVRLNALSEQQQLLLEQRREIIKTLRAEFKASLSEEQHALLKNDSMDKKERRKAFFMSLNDQQKELYKMMRDGVHQSRGAYRKSLSKRQKRSLLKRRKQKSYKAVPAGAPLPTVPPSKPTTGDKEGNGN